MHVQYMYITCRHCVIIPLFVLVHHKTLILSLAGPVGYRVEKRTNKLIYVTIIIILIINH